MSNIKKKHKFCKRGKEHPFLIGSKDLKFKTKNKETLMPFPRKTYFFFSNVVCTYQMLSFLVIQICVFK